MPSYILLNSGNHIGLNAGGAVLLNAQDAEVEVEQPSAITYGHGHDDDLERKVRAWWNEIEATRAENRAREESEREKAVRAAELERQRGEIEAKRPRQAQESQNSARVKRLAKIAAETAQIQADRAVLRATIDAAAVEIERVMANIRAAEVAQAERALFLKRRNVALALLLVAA